LQKLPTQYTATSTVNGRSQVQQKIQDYPRNKLGRIKTKTWEIKNVNI